MNHSFPLTLADWRAAYAAGARPGQLVERRCRFVERSTTAPHYRLYALPDTQPPKPGLARVADAGVAIEVEVYDMPAAALGSFLALIPHPLGLGSVQLADGRGADMNPAEIDDPRVIAEVTAAFHAYEHALMSHDVAALNAAFWPDARLTRYGIAEMIAFRSATPAPGFTRQLENLRICSFGPDMAVAQVEFVRSATPLRGFQTQTWVRLAPGRSGWQIVAAHVSMIPFAAPPGR